MQGAGAEEARQSPFYLFTGGFLFISFPPPQPTSFLALVALDTFGVHLSPFPVASHRSRKVGNMGSCLGGTVFDGADVVHDLPSLQDVELVEVGPHVALLLFDQSPDVCQVGVLLLVDIASGFTLRGA